MAQESAGGSKTQRGGQKKGEERNKSVPVHWTSSRQSLGSRPLPAIPSPPNPNPTTRCHLKGDLKEKPMQTTMQRAGLSGGRAVAGALCSIVVADRNRGRVPLSTGDEHTDQERLRAALFRFDKGGAGRGEASRQSRHALVLSIGGRTQTDPTLWPFPPLSVCSCVPLALVHCELHASPGLHAERVGERLRVPFRLALTLSLSPLLGRKDGRPGTSGKGGTRHTVSPSTKRQDRVQCRVCAVCVPCMCRVCAVSSILSPPHPA